MCDDDSAHAHHGGYNVIFCFIATLFTCTFLIASIRTSIVDLIPTHVKISNTELAVAQKLVQEIGTLHISIMTYPGRDAVQELARKLWIDEFRRSPYYGGIHFISEEKVTDNEIPTVICNWSDFDRPDFPLSERLSRRQAAKRVLSFGAFVSDSTASFHLDTTDDALVDVPNLRYLWEWIMTNGYRSNTSLVLGNCLWLEGGRNPSLLQGGAGYFMSRKSVTDFHASSMEWFNNMPRMPEDIWVSYGLKYAKWTVYEASSEFILGQYINPDQKYFMENKEYDKLPICPTTEYITSRVPARRCRVFLARFNRVVFLHRLSCRRFKKPPTHPHTYADDVYWYMIGEMPWFCRINGTNV